MTGDPADLLTTFAVVRDGLVVLAGRCEVTDLLLQGMADGDVPLACDSDVMPGWQWDEDGGFVPPPATMPALDTRRRRRKAAAREVRDDHVDGLCSTPLGVIQTPSSSRLNIAGLVSLASIAKAAGAPFDQPFRMADDSMVQHDANQMIALGIAVGDHVATCFAAYFAIADAINASDDPESIDITVGHPAA